MLRNQLATLHLRNPEKHTGDSFSLKDIHMRYEINIGTLLGILYRKQVDSCLIAKFRLKLKKVGKSTRPFRYDLIKSLMIIPGSW